MKMEEKVMTYGNAIKFLEQRQKSFNAFGIDIFPIRNQTQGKGMIILIPKQMLQRLPMAQPQVKADK